MTRRGWLLLGALAVAAAGLSGGLVRLADSKAAGLPAVGHALRPAGTYARR